jgi:cation transport regulator ChaB
MQQAMFWEQARARRVFVSAGASGGSDGEVVLGERIRSQSEDLARALFGYRKAFQSASSKAEDSEVQRSKAQETNARQDAASSMPRRHSRQCSQ